MRDFIYYGAWLGIIPLTFYSAHISILVWIWVALLPPQNLVYGRFPLLPFNKIVAGTAVFMLIAGNTRKDFYRDGIIVLVSLYAVVVTLSYFLQPYDAGAADLQYDKFWKEIVLFFLITGLMFTRHRMHCVALVVALSFGFVMVKEGLIFLLTAGGHHIEAIGSVGDNNGVALALLMTLPLLLYAAKYTNNHLVKLGMQVTVGLGIVTVIATYSRGGFVGLMVFGLMQLKGSKYKFRVIVGVIAFFILFLSLAPADYFARLNTLKDATDDNSFAIRLVAWKINFMMALDRPLIGNGLYASLAIQNWFRFNGPATSFLFSSPYVPISFVAHSVYFQVLGDTGITGFVLFVSILGAGIMATIRTQRLARRDPALEWAGDLARATQVSLAVYCVSGAALSLVYFELLYIILALVSRNLQTVRQSLGPATVGTGYRARPALQHAYTRAA